MKLKPVVASLVMLGLMAPAFARVGVVQQQAVVDQNSQISPICSEGWFNRISVGGVGNVVAQYGSQDPAGFFADNGSSSDLYVNNFNLLVKANLSSWSSATLNLAYIGRPDLAYSKNITARSIRMIDNRIGADEAYVQIANFAKSPFYVVAGKKYIPFGDYADAYVPYSIMSPTQMLAQINETTVIAGVASDFGLYASIFGFRGQTYSQSQTAGNILNMGAKLGYYGHLDEFSAPNTHVNVNVSYVRNIVDSLVFKSNIVGLKSHPIGGVSVHADVAYKPFSISANWVTFLKKYEEIENSKIWAADVAADYAFKTFDRDSSLGASVQWTGNGEWLKNQENSWWSMMPKWRVLGEYRVNLFKNTDLGLVVGHGKSYQYTDNKDYKTTIGLARLNVKF